MKLAFTISSAAILAALCTVGCTVGPNYHRADAPAATHWDVAEPWRESAPKDALGKGDWWEVFRDDDLNGFEHDALQSNQTIKISVARLEQARALAAVQISTQFPQFSTGLSPERHNSLSFRPVFLQSANAFPAIALATAVLLSLAQSRKTVTRFLSPSTMSSTSSAGAVAA